MKKTLTFYSALFILFLILQRGAGALTKIVIANAISPYEYGIITLVAISLPGMLQLVTTLNFYYILSHASSGKNFFGFTLAYSLLITIFLSIILFLFSKDFFGYLNLPLENVELFYLVLIISLFPLTIAVDFQGLLTGLKIYSYPGLIMALPSIFRLIVLSCLIYYEIYSFPTILVIFALSHSVPLIFIALSRQYRSYFGLIKSINIPSKKMFAFGASIFIVGSFSTLGQILIKIVVSHELGVEWQGYYDVSLTLAYILIFSLGTMRFVSIPEATSSDKGAIYKSGGLGDVTRVLFSLLTFLIIILYFYSDYIVVKIFSEDYILASEYIYILSIGYFFLFIQSFLANLNLSFAKNAKDYISLSVITLFCLPLFFFLTKFLIHFLNQQGFGNGFLGAYLSYTALLILYTLLTVYFSRDLSPIKILSKKADRLIFSSIITFLLILYLNPSPLIGIISSGILFSLLIFVSGYLTKEIFLEIFRGTKT